MCIDCLTMESHLLCELNITERRVKGNGQDSFHDGNDYL